MNRFNLSIMAVAVMITAVVTPAFPQTCSTPSFTHPPIYPVGTDVRSVASADFNGDGRPDIVTANVDSSSVSVLTNVGLGVPAINNSHSVGSFPLSVATGDFTGDGKPDIITANNSSGNLTLLRNDGAGNFVFGGNFAIGGGLLALAVGDFNGNGNLDVAVTTGFNVVVLLGNGQGGFAAPINVNVQGGASKVITADFNNDGKLDLAVVANVTRILLGNGTGNFPTETCGGTIPPASGLAAGDVNGDGKLDLVTANILSADIQVRLGDGLGCFGAPSTFDVLNFGRPGFVALGDLSNDGKLDIVAGATVLLGNGLGGFGSPTQWGMSSLGADPGANTVLGDFDGDGNLDIASGARGSAGILFGNGAGGFKFAVGPANRGAFGIARADLNGDGKLDVVAMTNGNFAVMLGDGTGNFGASSIIQGASIFSFAGPVIADFNRDTKLDVAVLDSSNGPGGLPRLHVQLGDGLGGFGSAISTSFNGSQPAAVAGGDFNGDGNPDLLTVNRGGGTNNEGSISIALGDGTGNFAPPPNLSVRTSVNPKAVGIADLNGDGKIDLAVPSGFGFTIMLGNGLGGFGPGTHVTSANASSIAVAEINGDNKLDLAMISEEQNGKLSVVFGDGLGGFSAPSQFVVGSFPSDVTVADFNGDSKSDVAVSILGASGSLSSISVLFGDGMGGFGPVSAFAAERTPTRIISGDFNGDLRPDLITANSTNNLTVLLNTCSGPTPASTFQFSAPAFSVGEGDGIVAVTVTRTGSTVGPASIRYATSDGTASSRSDYIASFGRLRFADGETTKSFNILIIDDARAIDDNESLNVTLSAPVGAILGSPSSAIVSIVDNDPTVTNVNPIDDPEFFVRQHYFDFLNRQPDSLGLQFWAGQIIECGNLPEPERSACREVRRINVSAAFFLAIEFQENGYFVYRAYKTAFGDSTSPNVPGTVPIVRLNELLGDSQQIGQGVIVGVGNWEQQLEINKNAYVLDFVQTQRFIDAFPLNMTPLQFVDKLNQNAGSVLTQSQHDQLVAQLSGAPDMTAGRAAVLRQVAENALLRQQEFNRAFVLMQYFGYLRRNPDDLPDIDFQGWKFWLDKLNQFNGNFIQAEMVKAFISSLEYRNRFNSPDGF